MLLYVTTPTWDVLMFALNSELGNNASIITEPNNDLGNSNKNTLSPPISELVPANNEMKATETDSQKHTLSTMSTTSGLELDRNLRNLSALALLASVALMGWGVTGNGHDREQGRVHNIISERCCPSDECYPSQMDMAALNHGMNGHLLLPSYPEYSKQAHMYNTVEQRYPNLIAVVKNADDIQKAVQFARKYNLHVTVRSSGHNYVGRSTWEGSFLISLSEMDEMEIDLSTERSPHGTVKV
ncbi:HDNO-like protein [Mya arenaria]|uniref:HDNO-like protein n=1 Tax=Mya arenaria TaxID=6604 RepID=A0ABY7FHG1_MYAAR|nr:HDNO-like protein [Mya arenaria]